jgi:RNA polymerase sigma factor (sigma-70 family)
MAEGRAGKVVGPLRRLALLQAAEGRTDRQLLEDFLGRRGEAAFEALVRRHGPMVLGVCRRVLRHAQDAEDAFQAVFLVLARRASAIRRRDNVGGWLHGVACHTARRAAAVRARRRRMEGEAAPRADPEVPEAVAGAADLRPLIDEELRRLPERYRLPVVLCDLEGRTRQEAARLLGWPEGTVASRLARARGRLRVRLARRGLAPAGLPAAGPALATAVPDALARAACGAPSGAARALMKGVLHDMFWSRIRRSAAVILALALAVGAGAAVHRALAAAPPPAPPSPAKDDKASRDGDDKPAILWRAKGNFKAGDSPLGALAVSPDGKTVALALNGSSDAPLGFDQMAEAAAAQLWDVDKLKKRTALTDPRRQFPDVVGSVTFSPDGKTVAVGDSTLTLWDAAKGKPKRDVPDQGSSLNAVAFSPDGKALAVVRADGLLRVVSAETGKERFAVDATNKKIAVPSAAFADDGKTVVTGDYEGTVKLWDAAKGKLQTTYSLKGKGGAPTVIVFSPDGKAAATAADGPAVEVWDLTTDKARTTVKGLGKGVQATQLAFAPDGATLAVGGMDGTVLLWDLGADKELTTLKGHKGSIHRLAYSADGQTLASGDEKGKVFVWSLEAEAPKK